MPRRMLNSLGEINSYSVEANNPNRIKKLKAALELAASIDEVKRMDAAAQKEKADSKLDALRACAPRGVDKLRNSEADLSQLTVNELKGVALVHMNKTLKGKRQEIVDGFIAARAQTTWKLKGFHELLDEHQAKYYHEVGTSNTTRELPSDGKVIPQVSEL